MLVINRQTVILFTLGLLTWSVGLYQLGYTIGHFTTDWYWYVLAIFYTVTINELFAHLICSHNLFKINTKRWTYKILTFLVSVDHAFGPLTSICLNHQNHHNHPNEGAKDNLDLRRHWLTVCSLSPAMFIYSKDTEYANYDDYIDKEIGRHKEILDDNWTFFVEEFSIPLTILYWIALYLIFPAFLFKVVFMGRVLIGILTFLVASFGHWMPFGYRDTPANNTSNNRLLLHYVVGLGLFSDFLHNNHHSEYKWTTTGSHAYRWFEIDLGSYVIKALRPLLR